MKSILFKGVTVVFLGASLFGLNACGEEEEVVTDEIVVDDDYYEFQDFILSEYEIPAVISLPDETANIGASTKPEVKHIDTDIKWEVNVGRNFQLLIEDYGDITDLVEVEKKELAEQKFFKVNYLIDEPDMILYERTLVVAGDDQAEKSVGVEHKSYHVYAQKQVGDIMYELQSREEGFEKMIIELMAKSIRSFKPIANS